VVIDAEQGDRGVFVDLDTGAVIPHVIRADTEAGWLERCDLDAAGNLRPDDAGTAVRKVRERRRFRFIRRGE
jgi:hypothetical protein